MPSQARPPESTSSVVTVLARSPGHRNVVAVTSVSSFTREVWGGDEGKHCVALQHVALRPTHERRPPHVIGHTGGIEPAFIGGPNDFGQVGAEVSGAAFSGVIVDMQSKLHAG